MRLYVTVDNAPLVGVGEPCRGLAQPEEFSAGERSPALERPEVASRHVFHDDVGGLAPLVLPLPRIVDLHYVRVRELAAVRPSRWKRAPMSVPA